MNHIPTVTRNLLIINVVVFIATYLMQMIGADLNSILGLHFILAPDFQAYQLLTYMFAHGGWSHIFFNMFALWMFGCIVERTWGARKFLFYYIACGIGAGLFQELAQMVQFYLLAAEQIPGFSLSQTMLVVKANAMFLPKSGCSYSPSLCPSRQSGLYSSMQPLSCSWHSQPPAMAWHTWHISEVWL